MSGFAEEEDQSEVTDPGTETYPDFQKSLFDILDTNEEFIANAQ